SPLRPSRRGPSFCGMTPPCYQILPVRALQTTFGDPQRLQMILRLGGCGVLPDLGLFPAEHLQDDVPGSALAHHVRHGPSGERALTLMVRLRAFRAYAPQTLCAYGSD